MRAFGQVVRVVSGLVSSIRARTFAHVVRVSRRRIVRCPLPRKTKTKHFVSSSEYICVPLPPFRNHQRAVKAQLVKFQNFQSNDLTDE